MLGFAAIFAIMCAGLLLMEFTNRYNGGIWLRDFQVFHRAGGRVLAGEELFRPVRDGYYSYKYSPTAAILFIPFSLIPFEAAEVVYWLFVSGLVLVGLYLSLLLIYPEFRNADPAKLGFLLALTMMTLGVHIWSELTLGQVNYLLLVMYIAIAWLFTQKKPVLLAFIWALSIFIKPFGLILLPYFLLKRRFWEIGYFCAFSGLLFLLPAVFYGTHFLVLQRSWISAITVELGNKVDIFQPGNHTLVAVLAQYSPLDVFEPGSIYLTVYKYMVLSLVALMSFLVVRKGSGLQRAEALDFAFILALAPLLSYTNNNAFVLAELGIILLLFNFGKLKVWEKVMAACGCLLIGGNFYNQLPYEWGEHFFAYYDSISLLTIGTILLLITIFMLRWRESL
ncbi:MAG: glycosyltransferase family 87 protein [Thermoleophilia bacterium]